MMQSNTCFKKLYLYFYDCGSNLNVFLKKLVTVDTNYLSFYLSFLRI